MQVTLVKNPSVGCHYFLPGLRLTSQRQSAAALGYYRFMLVGEQRHVCVNDLLMVTV